MSARCTICRHPERYRIELALAGGASRPAIAKRYGASAHSLARHLANHMSAERRAQLVAGPLKLKELADKAAEEGLALIDYLSMVRSSLLSQFLTCSETGDTEGAALLSGRLLECLRLLGQIQGDLQRTTANITNNTLVLSSPLMVDLQAMLIRVLQPHPEARAAVIAGLEDLSRRALPDTQAAAIAASVPALPGRTFDAT